MKKYLPTLLAAIFLVGVSPANAANYILDGPFGPGAGNCVALGGVYQAPRICVIETATGVTVQSVDTLTIGSFWTLRLSPGSHLFNSGSIDNSGLIDNNGSIHDSGTMTNDNMITNQHVIDIEDGGSLTNGAGGSITNDGTLDNADTLTNDPGATITNNPGAGIHNHDRIVNNGAITNNGVVYVDCEAEITGAGSLTGNDPIEDAGPHSDEDDVCDPDDCDPLDGTVWFMPEGASLSGLLHVGGVDGTTTIWWTHGDPGGTSTVYEAVVGFDIPFTAGLCVPADDGESHGSYDVSPPPGGLHFILARGRNSCGVSQPVQFDCSP